MLPPKAAGEKLPPLAPASGGSRHFLACGDITPVSASVFARPSPLCASVSVAPSLPLGHSSLHLGSTLIQDHLTLKCLTYRYLRRLFLQNKVTFTGGFRETSLGLLSTVQPATDDVTAACPGTNQTWNLDSTLASSSVTDSKVYSGMAMSDRNYMDP